VGERFIADGRSGAGTFRLLGLGLGGVIPSRRDAFDPGGGVSGMIGVREVKEPLCG